MRWMRWMMLPIWVPVFLLALLVGYLVGVAYDGYWRGWRS